MRLLEQVCGSLDEAHVLKLVHRDIKPANVMVTGNTGAYDSHARRARAPPRGAGAGRGLPPHVRVVVDRAAQG